MSELLRLPCVIERTGLSRSTIYRLESLGRFPRRVKVSERASAWRALEIDAFIESRPRAVESDAA